MPFGVGFWIRGRWVGGEGRLEGGLERGGGCVVWRREGCGLEGGGNCMRGGLEEEGTLECLKGAGVACVVWTGVKGCVWRRRGEVHVLKTGDRGFGVLQQDGRLMIWVGSFWGRGGSGLF